jgi:hypothetical protein
MMIQRGIGEMGRDTGETRPRQKQEWKNGTWGKGEKSSVGMDMDMDIDNVD